jgi:dihydrodipicolinate synthase/N-acetylneuraminate lyase
MVKGSTGDLSRMQRVDQLSGGRLPFYNGINPLVLDALQAGAAGWCTAGPCLRPQPCIDLYSAEGAGEFASASAMRIRALRSSLRRSCTRTKRTYRGLNVFGFFQHSTRVRDLRLADRYAPE